MTRKIIKRLFLVSILVAPVLSLAQNSEWKELTKDQASKELNSVLNWFSATENYSVGLTHASYKDYTTTVPYEVQKGYLKKYKRNYHSLIAGIHTVQNEKYRIVADTIKKYMMLANASELLLESIGMEQLLLKLELCSSIKTLTKSNEILYRLEYNKQNMQRMDIKINKDGLIKEIVYYLNKEIKNEDRSSYSFVQPRLVITLDNYKLNVKYNPIEFSESSYITWKDSKAIATGRYSAYEFFDSRVKK